MRKAPETLHRRTVAQSRLFRVEAVGLRFGNGTEVEFERLASSHAGGAVLIVPVTTDHDVLMIREYAAGTERYELGLPKGRVEPGEDMLVAANRELREEIGHGAREMICLRDMTVAPGYIAHHTRIILATDLYPEWLEGDEPEAIEVVPWPLAQLDELLQCDDLTEARSIAALYLARDHLRGNHQP